MWSLGCLIYQMHCNEELVSTDINQDVVLDRIKMAAEWTDEALWKRIETNIPDKAAQDLVKKLLVRDPMGRISAKDVLEHFYFHPEKTREQIHEQFQANTKTQSHINTLLDTTATLQLEMKALQQSNQVSNAVENLSQVVMGGMLEASENVSPTSFVVLPSKLNSRERSSIDDVKSFVHELMPTVNVLKTTYSTLTKETSLKHVLEMATDLTKALSKIDGGEPMYLYLIDEGTGKIVVREDDPVYPIEIPRNDTGFWSTALPWIESGFEWLQKGLEGVEGAQEWLDSCVSSGERTNDSESVKETTEEPATDNDGLPNVVQTASERPTVTHVQGAALREFTQWMLQHDCERTFGGLKRVITSNGTVLWTSSDSIDSI
ncbi:hypothetical protein As57867_001793, partial [Aphanomyces stellatus]